MRKCIWYEATIGVQFSYSLIPHPNKNLITSFITSYLPPLKCEDGGTPLC